MVDMPEGTALETTARVASALASAALEDETVVNVQQYVGTSAPYNFNGLVRHYFLRRAPHLADLQVNLVPKGERSAQSHDVARRVRDRLLPIAASFGATLQVAEVPPGPPVLQTLVAEIYGPDASAADGGGRAGQGDLRADGRRRGHRLVRRGAAAEGHARRRWREGRRRGTVVGGRGVGGPDGRLGRGRRAAARSRRRAKTSRSSSGCRAPTAASRRFSRCGSSGTRSGGRRRAHAGGAHAGRRRACITRTCSR